MEETMRKILAWLLTSAMFGALLTSMLMSGCSADANKVVAKTVVDVATASCILLAMKTDNGTIDKICATEEELAPLVKYLIGRRAALAAAKKTADAGVVSASTPNQAELCKLLP